MFSRTMDEQTKNVAAAGPTESAEVGESTTTHIRADTGKAIMTEEDVTDLMDLKSEDLTKPLELKVYRKWQSRNVPDPNPTGLCLILLDKKGDAIQANVQLWDMRLLDPKLQVGGCYRIQGYGCKKTDKWQRTLPNRMTLLFGKYTQLTPIEEAGFPEHYFNFAAYNEVSRRTENRDSILTDYIGIIRNVGAVKEFGDATTNRIARKNIDIQNLNGNVVAFTLWNEAARGFEVSLCTQLQQPVVIAVSSCWAKRFAGGVQLSATPATSYYLNPEIEEADQIRELYAELVGPPIPLTIPPGDAGSQVAEMHQGPVSIETLISMNPEAHMQQVFTTEATIMHIDELRGWYFNRCRTCHTKIADGFPHWHCQQIGTKTAPNYSYCLKLLIGDGTGELGVTCFSPAAESLLPPCDEVVNYIPEPNPHVAPPVIHDLLNTRHVFQLHLGTGRQAASAGIQNLCWTVRWTVFLPCFRRFHPHNKK